MRYFWKLMLGLLCVAVDTTFTIGGAVLDILPDFIGCMLVVWGIKDMLSWSPCFKKSRKFAVLLGITSLVRFILVMIFSSISVEGILLGLETMFFIYMTYYIMEGLYVKNKTEKIYELNQSLRNTWVAVAITAFLNCFLQLSDMPSIMEELGYPGMENIVILIIKGAALLVQIFFIFIMNQNRNLLEAAFIGQQVEV